MCMNKVIIEIYKWEGEFFPFKIKQKCGECSLSIRVIENIKERVEKEGIGVEVIEKPWLNNWYEILHKGAWHAPIIVVNGRVLSQGDVVTHEQLLDTIYSTAYKHFNITNKQNIIYTLPNCPYCKKSKELLQESNIKYEERNIIESSKNMRQLLALVQGKIHPITLPQVFLEGKWIGGCDDLEKYLNKEK